jgi:flavin-binding protein dodecin
VYKTVPVLFFVPTRFHSLFHSKGVLAMTVAKTIEISASSKKSFEDAVKVGVEKAAESLTNITGAWVMDQEVVVAKGKVTEYRVRMKLTFVLK